MKNIYTSFLASAALLLAGTIDAQSVSSAKTSGVPHGFNLRNPAAVPQHASNNALRGGGAPVNDGCGSVSTVVLPLGGSINFTGDNTGATEDGDYVAGSGLEGFGPVVWHKFSISGCATVAVAYCGTTPAFGNLGAFLAETCPATDASYITYTSGSFDACGDGNGTIVFSNVPAGEYYLPVLMDPDVAVGPYTITVAAVACPTPPANDECAGAISLTSGANCNLTYANTIGATSSMDPINCNGAGLSPTSMDVWFSFVCTSTEQSIGMVGYNAFDGVIELFSGSCGNLTSLGCADDTYPASADESVSEVLDQTGLTVGSTYYFRIYDYGETSADHTFATCVTEGSTNNVGIKEQNKATALSIYPNPGSGDFNLQYTGADGLGTIEVLDLTGRMVYSEKTQLVSGSTHTMNLSKLAQGQYSLRLTVNGTRSQQNLMVR